MTREPSGDDRRLMSVTAQTHGSDRAHDSHDRLLVARFALGDALAPDESATVRALLASCPGCTDLVAEMQLVQHATATSRAPARPRDFRITAEQAATLRPGAWRRFLGRFSAPRVAVMRPLAGATLALGIVLVGAGAVVPRQADAPVPGGDLNQTVLASPAAEDALMTGEGGVDETNAPFTARQGDANVKASPLAGVEMLAMPSSGPEIASAPASPGADPSLTAIRLDPPAVADDPDTADGTLAEVVPTDDGLGTALLILGVLLAAVSGLVLVLAWLARRVADPLLR